MENELVKSESSAPVIGNPKSRAMENIDLEDFVIPYIRLIQKMSNTDGTDAKFGDITSSEGDKFLGNAEKPAKFVVVKTLPKTFTISKKDGSMFRWCGVEPWDASVSSQWFFERDGIEHKREKTFHFYVMFEGDIAPSKISLRGASTKCGAQIATNVIKLTSLGKDTWENFMSLKSKKISGDGKSYCVFLSDLVHQKDESEAPSEDLQAKAKMWEELVSTKPNAIKEADENAADEIPF